MNYMLINEYGSSLLEVLIALFVLSCGLLSAFNLQINSMIRMRNSCERSIATVQLENMAAALQIGTGDSYFAQWNQVNQRLLPHGQGAVYRSPDGYNIKICWSTKFQENDCVKMTV